jgi:hypothetical protein
MRICAAALAIAGLCASEAFASDHNVAPNRGSEALQYAKDVYLACRTKLPNDGAVVLPNGVACFFGDITEETAKPILENENTAFSVLVVDSGGGEVGSAMNIGDLIVKNKANIVVSGKCMSSCANYWFVAANNKIIMQDSFVAWHGMPGNSSSLPEGSSAEIREAVDRVFQRSDQFVRA